MNRTYRLVWSHVHHAWKIVHEHARSCGKRGGRTLALAALLGAPLSAHGADRTALAGLSAPLPAALPVNGRIAAGSGSISQSGADMTVTQNTGRMVVNWNSFNIGAQASVTFRQPGADSVALNRVLSADPSQIFGRLNANGRVFLLNSAGVLFGGTARVDTGGLVASTLDMNDSDFLAGRYVFGNGGSAGAIVNQGQINGKSVVLIAPQVDNEGSINATGGSAVLAAGDKVSLDLNGDGLVSVDVKQGALNALVQNKGAIRADGGMVELTARDSGDLMATVVNNDGLVQARGLSEHDGRIILDGGEAGVTRAAGTLDASSADGNGGRIAVTGDKVLVDEGARLDATGKTGGGGIFVGGGWQGSDPSIRQAVSTIIAPSAVLDASATERGNGGTVVAWSDVHDSDSATRAWGTFLAEGGADSGDGGRIETSGHWLDTKGARGSAGAPFGRNGSWLFDPYDVTIDTSSSSNGSFTTGTWTPSGSGSTILNTDIDALLNSGTSVTVTTSGGGAEAGDITVNAPITKSSGGTDVALSLKADHSILLNSSITNTGGAGKLNVTLDSNSTDGGTGGILMTSGTSIITNGGDITLSGGSDPTTGFALGAPNIGDRGIWTQQDTTLDASGTASGGNIILRGNGTTTGEGMLLGWGGTGPASTIKTNGTGTISLTGTGGGQINSRWVTGISLWNTAIQTDSGAINIAGTGGAADGVDDNSGVLLDTNGVTTDNRIVSSTGAINITGIRGTGTTTLGAGIRFDSGNHAIGQDGSLVASSSSDITLETDSFQAGGSGILRSSGALTIQPHTASASIGIGDGASGTLDIRAAEISSLHDGFSSITIGRTDGTGAIDVQSAAFADNVVIRTPSGTGDITVNGALSTGTGTSAGSIALQAGNNVSIAAGGSVTTDGQAVTLNSDRDASGAGAIALASGASVATSGGDITLRGGNASLNTLPDPTVAATLNDFIFSGGLQVTGGRGDGASVAGVTLDGGTLNAGGGDIQVRGIGDDGKAGIAITGGATITTNGSGTISLYGAGGAGATDNDGVNISGSGTAVTSADGDITIYGQGRGTASSPGIVIDGTGAATAPKVESANGNVIFRGTSSATGASNQGVLLNEGGIADTTGIGNIDMIGRGGGTGADGQGIFLLTNGLAQTTGGGSISLTGYGSTSGTQSNNEGVKVMDGSLVEIQTGAGNMTVNGTGGTGQNYNIGVNALGGTFRMGSAATGAMTITGTGGGSSTGNWGILLENGGVYESLGAAPIELIGTGGTGSDNAGIKLTGGTTNRIGSGTMTGNVTLTSDAIDLDGVAGGTMSVQSSGALLIQPLTASASMGIGTGASGTFNLDGTEIGRLVDGFSSITIGRTDSSGAVDIRAVAFKDPLMIRTPAGSGNITVNGALATGSASEAGSILLQAGNSVTLAASASVTTQGEAVTLDADSDDSTAGTVTLGSGSSIASNGGNILLGGGSDPTTGYAAGAKAVWLNGTTVDSGGGDIVMRGKGQGADGSADTPGIKAESSTVDSGTGAITLLGDSLDGSAGIFLASGASFTSAKTNGTAISVTGNAGQTLASDNSPGLLMIDGSLTATGVGGNIVLNGLGGVSNTSGNTFNAKGIAIAGGAAATIQAEGTLTMTGTARGDVGDNSIGVSIENYSGNLGAKGGITITGNSQKAGISDVQLRQDSGTNTLGNATTSSITLIGDRIALAVGAGTTAMETSAIGTVSILPRTAGRAVSLGSADSNTVTGIDNTEFNRITTGTLVIGRDYTDSTSAGALSVDGALTFSAAKLPSIALRGTDITFNQSVTKNAGGDAALSAQASGDITLNAAGDLTGTAAGKLDVTLDADRDGNGTGILSLASGSSIATNGGNFTGTFGTMTASDAIGGSISTGAGNLSLTGSDPSDLRFVNASLGTTTGDLDIAVGNGTATGSKIELYGNTSFTTQSGNITLTQTDTDGSIAVGADAGGASIGATGSGNVTLDNSADSYLRNGASITASGGTVTLTASDNHFADVGGFTISNSAGTVAVNGPLAEGTGGSLTAGGLKLGGTGAFDLSAGANTVGTLAANGITSLHLKNSGSLTIGTVGAVDGVSASGDITLDTNGATADLTLDKPVTTTGGDILADVGRDFVNNNAANTGLVASGGRYLVYSSNPDDSVEGMTGYGKHYDQAYTAGSTPAYAASGNWFLYSIAPTITVTADGKSITYGDADPALSASYSGFIDGDTASALSSAPGLALAGYAPSGANLRPAGDYAITATAGSLSDSLGYQYAFADGTLAVAKKGVTIGGSRVYDGSANAGAADFSTIGGMLAGDALSVSGSGSLADKNVGSGKSVTTGTLALGGADAGNYSLLGTGNTLTVTPKALTVSADGISRVYDGTTDATVVLTDDRVAGDTLTVTNAAAAFADKNAGSGKAVNVTGISANGADAGNYTFNTTATATADITPKALTAEYSGSNKIYDGTTVASVHGSSGDVVGGDTVIFSQNAAFSDKNPGTGKTINITDIALSGEDAANYRLLNDSATATANIIQNDPVKSIVGDVTHSSDNAGGDSLPPGTDLSSLIDSASGDSPLVESELPPEAGNENTGSNEAGPSAPDGASKTENETDGKRPVAGIASPIDAGKAEHASISASRAQGTDGNVSVDVPASNDGMTISTDTFSMPVEMAASGNTVTLKLDGTQETDSRRHVRNDIPLYMVDLKGRIRAVGVFEVVEERSGMAMTKTGRKAPPPPSVTGDKGKQTGFTISARGSAGMPMSVAVSREGVMIVNISENAAKFDPHSAALAGWMIARRELGIEPDDIRAVMIEKLKAR